MVKQYIRNLRIRRAEKGELLKFRTYASESENIRGGLRTGVTLGSGESYIFLGSIIEGLEYWATRLGRELKEENVSDQVIESIIHESVHGSIRRAGIDLTGEDYGEEDVVDHVTGEVMGQIQETEPLVPKHFSSEAKRGKSR